MNGYYVKILPTISPSSAFKDYEADEAVSGQYVHSMFGNRPTTGAMCPNCRMPLTPFLNLNLADGRISFLSLFGKQLVLYYCLGCAIPFGEFQYRLDADGRVSVLRYEAGVLSQKMAGRVIGGTSLNVLLRYLSTATPLCNC